MLNCQLLMSYLSSLIGLQCRMKHKGFKSVMTAQEHKPSLSCAPHSPVPGASLTTHHLDFVILKAPQTHQHPQQPSADGAECFTHRGKAFGVSRAPLTFRTSSPGSRNSSKELLLGYPHGARMLQPKSTRSPPGRDLIHLQDVREASTNQSSSVFNPLTSWSKGRFHLFPTNGARLSSMHKALRSALASKATVPRTLPRDLSTACSPPKAPGGSGVWSLRCARQIRERFPAICSPALAAVHARITPYGFLSSSSGSKKPHAAAMHITLLEP